MAAESTKVQFEFDRRIENPEVRKARALEFIAHYLDRIDGHLERIATDLEKGPKNDSLMNALSGVAGALSRSK